MAGPVVAAASMVCPVFCNDLLCPRFPPVLQGVPAGAALTAPPNPKQVRYPSDNGIIQVDLRLSAAIAALCESVFGCNLYVECGKIIQLLRNINHSKIVLSMKNFYIIALRSSMFYPKTGSCSDNRHFWKLAKKLQIYEKIKDSGQKQ